jgi:hypothetical protein
MARKYSKGASNAFKSAIERRKKSTLKRGKGGRGGTVKSRKQAIAIGLSETLKKDKKVITAVGQSQGKRHDSKFHGRLAGTLPRRRSRSWRTIRASPLLTLAGPTSTVADFFCSA